MWPWWWGGSVQHLQLQQERDDSSWLQVADPSPACIWYSCYRQRRVLLTTVGPVRERSQAVHRTIFVWFIEFMWIKVWYLWAPVVWLVLGAPQWQETLPQCHLCVTNPPLQLGAISKLLEQSNILIYIWTKSCEILVKDHRHVVNDIYNTVKIPIDPHCFQSKIYTHSGKDTYTW